MIEDTIDNLMTWKSLLQQMQKGDFFFCQLWDGQIFNYRQFPFLSQHVLFYCKGQNSLYSLSQVSSSCLSCWSWFCHYFNGSILFYFISTQRIQPVSFIKDLTILTLDRFNSPSITWANKLMSTSPYWPSPNWPSNFFVPESQLLRLEASGLYS